MNNKFQYGDLVWAIKNNTLLGPCIIEIIELRSNGFTYKTTDFESKNFYFEDEIFDSYEEAKKEFDKLVKKKLPELKRLSDVKKEFSKKQGWV
jgi:hypothetical protein